MRRATLLLTLSLLAGGCVSRTCRTDVSLYWIFPNATSTAELSCDQAGVATIQVSIDGANHAALACVQLATDGTPVQGVTYQDFEPRPYQFTINAYDAAGNITYTDAFSFTPASCQNNLVDRTLTSTGANMNVSYSLVDPQGRPVACASPISFIWYEVVDQNGAAYSTVNATSSPTAIQCGAGGSTILFTGAPYGRYTLTRIQEVVPGPGNTYAVVSANCNPTTFQHAVPEDGITVTVPVVQPGSPGCF